MTRDVVIMYVVAAVLGLGGVFLLLQLRETLSDRGRYQRLIAGTMLAMLGIILAGFATAMWSWSTAP